MMVALALPALAQDRRGGSLDRVLPHVRQTVPGKFYDAEGPFFGSDGRPTYRLKWMTPDNRIIWFSVDAQTGQVIGGAPSGPPPARARQDGYQAPPRGNWPDERNNWGSRGGPDNGWSGRGGSDNGWSGRGSPDNGWGNRGGTDNSWGSRGGSGNGWGNRGGTDNGWGGRGGTDNGWGNRPGARDGGNDRGSWGSRDGRNRDGDRGNDRSNDRGNWGGRNDPGSNHGNDNRGGRSNDNRGGARRPHGG